MHPRIGTSGASADTAGSATSAWSNEQVIGNTYPLRKQKHLGCCSSSQLRPFGSNLKLGEERFFIYNISCKGLWYNTCHSSIYAVKRLVRGACKRYIKGMCRLGASWNSKGSVWRLSGETSGTTFARIFAFTKSSFSCKASAPSSRGCADLPAREKGMLLKYAKWILNQTFPYKYKKRISYKPKPQAWRTTSCSF